MIGCSHYISATYGCPSSTRLLVLILVSKFRNARVIYDKQDFVYPFWENLVKKLQNCVFKMKFGSYAKSNKLNLMMMFTFSFLN